MENVVYADLYFLINFSMDFLCFFLSGKLISKPLSPLRMALASAVGGVYAIALLFISAPPVWLLTLHVLVSALMCLIAMTDLAAFGELPYHTLVFTAISMFLGGAMTALMSLFDKLIPEDMISNADGTSDSISVYALALLAVIAAVITLVGGNSLKSRMARPNATVTLEVQDKTASFRGLSDSGNLLREPISGKPCIVVAPELLSEIMPREITKMIKQGTSAETLICKCRESTSLPLRLIPAKTATGGTMLLGFIPDKIYINTGRTPKLKDAAVAVGLIDKNASGVEALIPSELMI